MMNNQINSSSGMDLAAGGGSSNVNSDREKLEMMDQVREFMDTTEVKKRMKGLTGGRGTRLNVDVDEVRQFNPRLSQYIIRSPIEAINMFENNLNNYIRGLE